jgi:hypothetical protein
VSQHQPDTLMVFFEPSGSLPLPPSFHDAAIRFEQGRIEYEQQHRFVEAAQHFLEAARLLLPSTAFTPAPRPPTA